MPELASLAREHAEELDELHYPPRYFTRADADRLTKKTVQDFYRESKAYITRIKRDESASSSSATYLDYDSFVRQYGYAGKGWESQCKLLRAYANRIRELEKGLATEAWRIASNIETWATEKLPAPIRHSGRASAYRMAQNKAALEQLEEELIWFRGGFDEEEEYDDDIEEGYYEAFPVHISEKDRKRHTYISGGTGSGKSELIKVLVHNYQ